MSQKTAGCRIKKEKKGRSIRRAMRSPDRKNKTEIHCFYLDCACCTEHHTESSQKYNENIFFFVKE